MRAFRLLCSLSLLAALTACGIRAPCTCPTAAPPQARRQKRRRIITNPDRKPRNERLPQSHPARGPNGLELEGVSLVALAERHGTPSYVYPAKP